jgi:hypothetical protein
MTLPELISQIRTAFWDSDLPAIVKCLEDPDDVVPSDSLYFTRLVAGRLTTDELFETLRELYELDHHHDGNYSFVKECIDAMIIDCVWSMVAEDADVEAEDKRRQKAYDEALEAPISGSS